jgi:hypothetical protein
LVIQLDKDYLKDYKEKEDAEYAILLKEIENGNFSLGNDKYPPDNRFVRLGKPVAFTTPETARPENLWATIPFSGSTLVLLLPVPQAVFEKQFFKMSEIPKVIDFIKETGRLQICLRPELELYEGLDYLDPFFKELNPPAFPGIPVSVLGKEESFKRAAETYYALGDVRFFKYVYDEIGQVVSKPFLDSIISIYRQVYIYLKLGSYASIVEKIENSMIDEPEKAFYLFHICNQLIVTPNCDMRSNSRNYTLEEIKTAQELPKPYSLDKINFPCEIGKFLMKDKLTYAPLGLEACKDVIYHYKDYDLQKVAESLNDGIMSNRPDLIAKSSEDFSKILDNIWNDKTIPNRIKAIEIGVPVSIAAIGGVSTGLIGFFAGGFLSELGLRAAEKATEKFAEKLFNADGEGLTERLAKVRVKSYQANLYDFKKKYRK